MADDLKELRERIELAEQKILFCGKLFMEYGEQHIEIERKILREINSYRIVATANADLPTLLKVETRLVAHELRATLDSLACTLAFRNGREPRRDTSFPISASEEVFKREVRKVRRLRDTDIAKIVALKPYDGGHPYLFQLNETDRMGKHQRLSAQSNTPGNVQLAPGISFGAGVVMKGGTINGRPAGTIRTADSRSTIEVGEPVVLLEGGLGGPDLQWRIDLVWQEPDAVKGKPVFVTLGKFVETVRSVVDQFE